MEKLDCQILKDHLVLQGKDSSLTTRATTTLKIKKIVNVAAGRYPAECIVVQQLNTALDTKVAKTLLSIPSVNTAEGQIPTYDSKKALFSRGLIINNHLTTRGYVD